MNQEIHDFILGNLSVFASAEKKAKTIFCPTRKNSHFRPCAPVILNVFLFLLLPPLRVNCPSSFFSGPVVSIFSLEIPAKDGRGKEAVKTHRKGHWNQLFWGGR